MRLIRIVLMILITACGVCNQEVNAQQSNAADISRLEDFISTYEIDGRFSGTLIAIKNDEVVFEREYGYSDKNTGKLIDRRSIFGLASVSKIFTSTAIIKLLEEGKLSLDDKLCLYFPDLPDIYADVSVLHLLTHTSGIPDFHSKPVFDVHNSDIYNFVARQKELEFIPGTQYKYTNTGFVLLAMIVEKIEGQSYPVYMERKFFKPLGMKDTFFGRSEKKNRIVTSYLSSGEIADRNNFYYGPGEQFTTASDLVKWDKAYFSGGVISKEIMKKVLSVNKLLDGTETAYGLGWGVLNMGGDKLVGHTGGNYGFRTIYMHNLNKDYSIILLSNIGDKCPAMEIVTGIMTMM